MAVFEAFISAWCALLLSWDLVWTTNVGVWVDAFPWFWGVMEADLIAMIVWHFWVFADGGTWQADASVVSEWEACTSLCVVALPWLV